MMISAVIYLLFAALLVAAAVIDLRTLRIPNLLIAGLALLWIVWRVALGFGGMFAGTDFLTSFVAPDPFRHVSFATGVIGAMYEAVTKKRAMGGGDIKLLVMVGLFLGLERGVACLLVACVVSLLLALILPRVQWGDRSMTTENGYPILRELPFGPSSAVGAAFALFVS